MMFAISLALQRRLFTGSTIRALPGMHAVVHLGLSHSLQHHVGDTDTGDMVKVFTSLTNHQRNATDFLTTGPTEPSLRCQNICKHLQHLRDAF